MSYQYSAEARDRISALGQVEISDFLDQVPVGLRRSFYEAQPPIPGFRRGTEPELKKKQERLITHLMHPQIGPKGEADWKLLSNFWVGWGINKLGAGFPKGDSATFPPDDGAAFLKHLADNLPSVSRETVERLFLFSGFAQDSDILAAIARFHSTATLARDRVIDQLPSRVDRIEAYIEDSRPATNDLANRISQSESGLEVLTESVERAASDVRKVQGETGDLRADLEEVIASCESLSRTIRGLSDTAELSSESIFACERRQENLEKNLESLTAKMDTWAKLFLDLDALREAIYEIGQREPDWAELVEAVGGVRTRLGSLELEISKGESGLQAKPQVRIYSTESAGPFVDITSPEIACETIAWNLQACGVLKGNAVVTARQIVAALASGQIVQFMGSIADLIAESVLVAVGGPLHHEWRVPVGLISDEIATECLDMLGDVTGGLVVKGANLSAFEVYGTAFRDVVVRRQYAAWYYPHLALFASWTEGPAAFPDGGALAELGPVFNTDLFRMRGGVVKLPALKSGRLISGSWDQILDVDFAPLASLVKDFKGKLRDAGFAPGNLWLRSAERAIVRLRTLQGASEQEDLHAMLSLWASPWARASGGPADDIDRLADQILSDSSEDATSFEAI
ncbi:hypothetical protein [Pseudomonas syringae]|uniref:hypothetical protein n=1 Tax=Pseudomonas syringae TaxID=317 RepID=UPI00073F58B1|nr:hypothetical protein [Pseudomonas syringae]